MATLYQLTGELLSLQTAVEADGELTPELEAVLDGITNDLELKAQGYCQVLRHLEGDADIINQEIERLKAYRQVKENAVKRLKDRLHQAMTVLGLTRIDTDLFRLTVCKNSRPSIRWEGNLAELPAEFARVKVELDTDKALAALKEGKELPSQFSVEHGTHLRIK